MGTFAVLAVAAALAGRRAADPSPALDPAAAIERVMPDEGGGLRSMDWSDVTVGEWDSRTVVTSTASAAMRGLVSEMAAAVARAGASDRNGNGPRLPGGHVQVLVERWQADLAKVVARATWRSPAGGESFAERVTFRHRDPRGGRAIERGAALFRARCAGCHGVAGGGVAAVAPALSTAAFHLGRLAEVGRRGDTAGYVTEVVAAGRHPARPGYLPLMPAFGRNAGGPWGDREVRDVAAFVAAWAAPDRARAAGSSVREAGARRAAPREAIAVGEAVYRARECLGCHGRPGRGGITGPDPVGIAADGATRVPGLDPEQYVRLAILGPSAWLPPSCPTGPCPDMMPRDYGDRLSQGELDALAVWLVSLDPAAGGAGPRPAPFVGGLARPTPRAAEVAADGAGLYADHCAGCHGARGEGRHGPDLAPALGSAAPVDYVAAAVADGVPWTTMPGWIYAVGGPLSPIEVDAVAEHVVALVRARVAEGGGVR